MAFKAALLFLFFVTGTLGRPQTLNDFNAEIARDLGDIFNPNPVYSYGYQVSSDESQTYMAHQESRDGDSVNGEYSYIDPYGSLVTVTYHAGPNGYTENRNVQENFVTIRARPSFRGTGAVASVVRTAPAPVPSPVQPVRRVIQRVRPVVQEAVVASTGSDNSELVARIIAQLTPFIHETVTSSFAAQPAVSRRRQQVVSSPVVQNRPLAASASSSSSSLSNIFGFDGQSNVQFETPNFQFAYDFGEDN